MLHCQQQHTVRLHLLTAASLLPRGTSSLHQPVTCSQNKRIPRVFCRTVAAPKTAVTFSELHTGRTCLRFGRNSSFGVYPQRHPATEQCLSVYSHLCIPHCYKLCTLANCLVVSCHPQQPNGILGSLGATLKLLSAQSIDTARAAVVPVLQVANQTALDARSTLQDLGGDVAVAVLKARASGWDAAQCAQGR